MVDAPCSRIGHIYRKFAPFPNPGIGDFMGRNYKRVAEVWMDEYAEYIYKRKPHYRNIDAGDLSAQLQIREKLKCKDFKWFMTEIAFDLTKKYPPVEPPVIAEGEIRLENSELCVDTQNAREYARFKLRTCISVDPHAGGEQKMTFTWHRDIRPRKKSVCFDVSSSVQRAPIVLFGCHAQGGNQLWKYLTVGIGVEIGKLRNFRSCRTLDNYSTPFPEPAWTVIANEERFLWQNAIARRILSAGIGVS